MEQNEQQPAAAAGAPSDAPPPEMAPEAQFAEAMLSESALSEVVSPDVLPPEAQLSTVLSPEAPLPRGSARNQGYIRRVVGATFHYGLGQALPQVIRFLLLPVFTRILTPAEYGFIDLSNKFGAFLMTPMRMGVPGAVTRFYYDYPEGPSLKDYVTTVAWFVLFCSGAVALAALVIGPWALGHLLPGLPFIPFAVLSILSGLLYCNLELQNRLVQAREQASYAARLNIGRASISISLAVVFVVVLHWGAAGLLSAEVASYGVLALVAAHYLRPELKGRFRWPMLRSSLAYGAALLPGDFAGSLTPLVTQGILANVKSMAAAGVLTVASKFAQPLTILAYAFSAAFNPIYFSMRKEGTAAGLQRLAVTARNVWALAIFGALGVALLGPSLIVFMMPANYHEAGALLPILVVSFLGMIINSLFGCEIYYSKQTWWVPFIVYSSAAVDVTVSALTVSRYGAAGVAWGASARAITNSLLFAVISLRLVKIPHQWFSLLRITLCGVAAACALFWMSRQGGIAEFAVGVLGVVAFPILLWVTGDSSVRDGLHLVRRQMAKVF
jgi:O-antigen/teichoic acid export membrane protein